MIINDPIEKIVANGLIDAGIKFTHESENKHTGPDFILEISGVSIECKQFPSDRTEKQLLKTQNIILIQGELAAIAFSNMIRNKR